MSSSLKSFQVNVEDELDVQQQLCNHVAQDIGLDTEEVVFAHQTDSENVDQGRIVFWGLIARVCRIIIYYTDYVFD